MEEPPPQQQVKVLFFTPVRVMDVGAVCRAILPGHGFHKYIYIHRIDR
jgi:hypothetical protein